MKIEAFTDLEIWSLARSQAIKIFELINREKFSRDWELRNQINRSGGSVMDNIAEGFDRSGKNEFIHFLLIAKGSNAEVQSQLYRAFDRKYLDEKELNDMISESIVIHKKIITLIKYLKSSVVKGFRYKK